MNILDVLDFLTDPEYQDIVLLGTGFVFFLISWLSWSLIGSIIDISPVIWTPISVFAFGWGVYFMKLGLIFWDTPLGPSLELVK